MLSYSLAIFLSNLCWASKRESAKILVIIEALNIMRFFWEIYFLIKDLANISQQGDSSSRDYQLMNFKVRRIYDIIIFVKIKQIFTFCNKSYWEEGEKNNESIAN